ncbi:MAG: anaerobic ribonucleoside-triphosphate reductase activating protein [Candidatus Diapherotrites archaeon]|nr:anaerobic ribonucleoside-triphosphate reductase activating protein [Candidatus Diapherotrites archaeon]
MIIKEFTKVSLLDFPHHISSIIFTQGCNFRCGYCHNPQLVEPARFPPGKTFSEDEILSYLDKRKGQIDGLVITGGEPTLQPDLYDFIKKVKQKGFLVKLDTNGTNPDIVEKLIQDNLVDYIAMDYKAPIDKYKEIVRADVDTEKIKQSVALLMKNKVDYEFRTTVSPAILSFDDVMKLTDEIKGAKRYALQQYIRRREQELLDPTFSWDRYSRREMEDMYEHIKDKFDECILRVYY